MSSKITFSQDMQAFATQLTTLKNLAANLAKTYSDRTYNSGGANQIVDADVSSLGIKAADVASGVNLCNAIVNLMGNAAVTQADWQSVADLLRTDL